MHFGAADCVLEEGVVPDGHNHGEESKVGVLGGGGKGRGGQDGRGGGGEVGVRWGELDPRPAEVDAGVNGVDPRDGVDGDVSCGDAELIRHI